MDTSVFGATVEEVQQKLNDNLPLVQRGEEQAEELVGRLGSEGPNWDRLLDDMSAAGRMDGEILTRHDAQLQELEGEATEKWEQVSSQTEQLTERAENVLTSVQTSRESMEQDIRGRLPALSSTSETVEEGGATVRDLARTLLDDVNKTEQSFQNARDAMIQEMNNRIGQHNESDPEFRQRLTKLIEEDLPGVAGRVADAFTVYDGLAVKLTDGTKQGLAAAQAEMQALVADVRTDADGMVDTYREKHLEEINALPQEVVPAVTEVEEQLQAYASDAEQKLSAEVMETKAVVETARSFFEETTRLVDEVAEAKAAADKMNDAL